MSHTERRCRYCNTEMLTCRCPVKHTVEWDTCGQCQHVIKAGHKLEPIYEQVNMQTLIDLLERTHTLLDSDLSTTHRPAVAAANLATEIRRTLDIYTRMRAREGVASAIKRSKDV